GVGAALGEGEADGAGLVEGEAAEGVAALGVQRELVGALVVQGERGAAGVDDAVQVEGGVDGGEHRHLAGVGAEAAGVQGAREPHGGAGQPALLQRLDDGDEAAALRPGRAGGTVLPGGGTPHWVPRGVGGAAATRAARTPTPACHYWTTKVV